MGEDTRLLMWDFSVSALRRPRAVRDWLEKERKDDRKRKKI